MNQLSSQQFPQDKGLLWSYRLDGQGGGHQQDQLADADKDAPAFDWFHLRSDENDSVAWMRAKKLDPQIIEVISQSETRPRMALIDGGVLINLRGVNKNPGADPEDMIAIRIWFNKDTIITARKKERVLLSVEDVRNCIHKGTGPKTPAEFVCMLIEYMANRIGDVVDEIDETLTQAETDLGEDHVQSVQQKLFVTRKQIAAIRRYLAPQREALVELSRGRGILREDEVHHLQHQTDRITHYVEDLDLARERALVLQSDLQNRSIEKQNARMYLLSVVAAVFLPLSFLTGVFGMNVAGLPGLENPAAFLYLSGGMLILGVGLLLFMRLKKWL